MPSDKDPLDWYIEVCVVCGCQLGPGIGSRTSTGRCVEKDHHKQGGVVIRVIGKPLHEQERRLVKPLVEALPHKFLSTYYNTD